MHLTYSIIGSCIPADDFFFPIQNKLAYFCQRGRFRGGLFLKIGEYANIESAIQIPRGIPDPVSTTAPIRWDMDSWDDAVFQTLPEWVQEKIKRSTQYQKNHAPAEVIQIPAAEPAPAAIQPTAAAGGVPF